MTFTRGVFGRRFGRFRLAVGVDNPLMIETKPSAPLLSVVTVVRNDLPGLHATLNSLRSVLSRALDRGEIQHIVVDGSTDDDIRDFLRAEGEQAPHTWVSEPDQGIYDAMNKGLALARGRYVVFVNGGDVFSAFLDWAVLAPHLRAEARVLLAYSIERFEQDGYLRPGLGRESAVFGAPSHQATFYPRAFYEAERYRLDLPVKADGEYTRRAIESVGALFVPTVVACFGLGGVSSSYGQLKVLRRRLAEQDGLPGRLKLLIKFVVWRLMPQRWFYRLLAWGKYTMVDVDKPLPVLRTQVLACAPTTQVGGQGSHQAGSGGTSLPRG